MWHNKWINEFKKNPGYNDAEGVGVKINPNKHGVWKCLGVHHLSASENVGNHNIFFDVLYSNWERWYDIRLSMKQGNQKPVTAIVEKPLNEPGGNFPVWGATPVTVYVTEKASNSDTVSGMTIALAGPPGSGLGHNSFYVVFVSEIGFPKPPPPPKPEPEKRKLILQMDEEYYNSIKRNDDGYYLLEIK